MKSNLPWIIGLTLACLSLLSMQCDNVTGPQRYSQPSDLRTIVPMEIGYSWNYRTIDCGIGGCDTTMDSLRIVDMASIDGRNYYKYQGKSPHIYGEALYGESSYFESIDSSEYSVYFCPSCYRARGLMTVQFLPLRILKTPLIKGHSWRVAEWDSQYRIDLGTLTIVNADTTIEIEAVKFHHAIQLRQWIDGLEMREYFFVPGVGVVKQSGGILDSGFERKISSWSIN